MLFDLRYLSEDAALQLTEPPMYLPADYEPVHTPYETLHLFDPGFSEHLIMVATISKTRSTSSLNPGTFFM